MGRLGAFASLFILFSSVRHTSCETCSPIEPRDNEGCMFNQTWCGWTPYGWEFLYGSADNRLFTYCGFRVDCMYDFIDELWDIDVSYSDHYAYVDTNEHNNKTALLVTSEFPASTSDVCLQFFYKLYRNTGTLSIKLLFGNKTSQATALERLPSHNDENWHFHQMTVSQDKLQTPFKLAFVGHVRSDHLWFNDMALDDVETVPIPCPAEAGDCSFEVICSAWTRNRNDNTRWSLSSAGNIPKEGPTVDHTFSSEKGRYIFVSGRNKRAVFSSYALPQHRCLSFWFYCSSRRCDLQVFKQKNLQTWSLMWSSNMTNFLNSKWTFAIVSLEPEDDISIHFRGVTGSHEVVAVDDIKFHNTTCKGDEDKVNGAVTNMSRETSVFPNLKSPLFCTANYQDFRLIIQYKINCQDGACLLEVLKNDAAGTMTLWNTTTHTVNIQTYSLTVQPHGDTFSIIIRAKKLNTPGWALEILVDSVTLEPGDLTTSTAAESTTGRSVPGASPKQTQGDSSDGLAVGVGVSVGVVVLMVALVVVVVLRRRKNSSINTKHKSPGITSESPSEFLTPAVANAAYSPDSYPDSVHLASNDVDNTYAKVNKPRKVNDVYSVPNKGPKAAASRVAANSDEGDDAEADHYSVPDDADSGKRKGDNGYELAAAKLSMAPNTTPRNTGLNRAKGSAGSKPSRGFNPGAERQDEYNKLSLQTPRMASPAIPDTDNTYNHLDEHKHGAPTDPTGGNEYSLAKPTEAVNSKTTGNPRRQDYVNVNPNTSPREEEYNTLDFDCGHAPNSAVRSTGTTGGQDDYNHLQADGPGFKVQREDDQYNALDFDSHGKAQTGDDELLYSNLSDDQTAV